MVVVVGTDGNTARSVILILTLFLCQGGESSSTRRTSSEVSYKDILRSRKPGDPNYTIFPNTGLSEPL